MFICVCRYIRTVLIQTVPTSAVYGIEKEKHAEIS